MGFMDIYGSMKDGLMKEVKKFKNEKFLDAVLASCVMVSASDGDISSSEKAKMLGYVERSSELKVFKTSKVRDRFTEICSTVEFDATIGKMECEQLIKKIRDADLTQRETCIAVACAIGSADGDFDKDEKAMVKNICRMLNVQTSKFDL